ncbi:ANTAR domain-containing protein [Lentzea sp. NBRC 105346]|uniref:ANTAR domain-containing protein n=1 Tax=Lentzea sp. NBRC 105346 TaxID=3032205 RepID=UPI00255668FD|nr:ANTAR domain-containing protein [Lentzea sp. NBRC 105346]
MKVTSAVAEQALVLRLSGVFEPDAAGTLADATATLPPPALVVLDLRELEQLPAAGVRTLDAFVQSHLTRGVRCALVVEPVGAVACVLDTADPGGALPRYADLESALIARAERATVDADELVAQFESLTRTLLTATTVADALDQIVTAALHVVPAAEVVSVTLRAPDGTFTTPVETHHIASELDQVQYRSGLGPCIDAAHPSGPGYTISIDLRAERRWPQFAEAAVAHGLRAVLSTELIPASGRHLVTGALNMYARTSLGFTDADRHAALLLATHASLALAHMQTAEIATLHRAQLRRAIDSRDIIGQAKGILMNRQGITADEAFDLLRRTSQELNVKLVDVAAELITRRTDPEPI